MEDGTEHELVTPGPTGWFTLGGARPGLGSSEARFYARATDKHYVAMVRGVSSVVRDDVVMRMVPPFTLKTAYGGILAAKAAKTAYAAKAKKLREEELENLASAIVKGVTNPGCPECFLIADHEEWCSKSLIPF